MAKPTDPARVDPSPLEGGRLPRARRRQVVHGVLLENARQLDDIPKRRLVKLYPVLQQAKGELAGALRDWLRGVPDGRERFTAQHLRNALAHVNRAMRRLRDLHGLGSAMDEALVQGGREAAQLSIKHVERELALFSQVFEGSVIPVDLRPAAILAAGDEALIPRHHTSAERYRGQVGADIRNQLAIGVASHETFHQMTNRLVRLGGPRGLVALRGVLGEPGAHVEDIAEGLFRRYRHWAERVVRTETINAYNVAHYEAIDQAVDDDARWRFRWDAALDRRVCPICRELDGQIVKRGELFRGGFRHPPGHPNCRCSLVPWMEHWPEYLDLRDTPTGMAA